jgi:glycosyltransferase involved in cell wall biosynthesis
MPGFYRTIAASCGFLLSTAIREWCPMNILEALACGCPVIAPIVGGIPEIVVHKVTGYLYDKKEGILGLEEGVRWLYSEDNYSRASSAARDHILSAHTIAGMTSEYLKIYESALVNSR